MVKKRIVKLLLLILVITIVFGIFYVNNYYHALEEDIEAYQVEKSVNVNVLEGGMIVCEPEKAIAGMIFYPGSKVEYTSYLPLMKECASKGNVCVLLEMPLNLAVLDIKAADGVQEKYPEITSWYMAGHSLGGSMAASYIETNVEKYEGLVLLGA